MVQSKQPDDLKVAAATIKPEERDVNVLNSGNAGFYQGTKPNKLANSGLNSSLNTTVNEKVD